MKPKTVTPDSILDFWFDRAAGRELQPRKAWWEKNPAFDEEIRQRFNDAVERALAGNFEDWRGHAEGALALVILLDQFPRNLFRGQPKAYAGDERARTIAHAAIGRGFDIVVPPVMRQFFYMPLQHSEAIEEQDLSVLLFTALEKELTGNPGAVAFFLQCLNVSEPPVARFIRITTPPAPPPSRILRTTIRAA